MKKRLKRKFRRIKKYLRGIEGRGAWQCVIDDLLQRERLRCISIHGSPVWVRTYSADVLAAINSLHKLEYDSVKCASPKLIIDAGANIGTSAIYFAQQFPQAKIISIEPEQSNFDLLLKNTKDYPQVTAIKAAIWGKKETRAIQQRADYWGFTVSETSTSLGETGQEIDCLTIDSLMDEHGFDTIDILKMDIEGGEKEVLENCETWIDRVEIMAVELHERICKGCEAAFYKAAEGFAKIEHKGEKTTAYRSVPQD